MHTSELFAESEKVERFEGSLAALEGAVDPQADDWLFGLSVISLGFGFDQRFLHFVLAKLLHLTNARRTLLKFNACEGITRTRANKRPLSTKSIHYLHYSILQFSIYSQN